MNQELITALISTFCAVAGFAFGFAAFRRNDRSDAQEAGAQNGKILNELAHLKQGIDEVNTRLCRQEERYLEVITLLSETSSSVKQAHRRIDEQTLFDNNLHRMGGHYAQGN